MNLSLLFFLFSHPIAIDCIVVCTVTAGNCTNCTCVCVWVCVSEGNVSGQIEPLVNDNIFILPMPCCCTITGTIFTQEASCPAHCFWLDPLMFTTCSVCSTVLIPPRRKKKRKKQEKPNCVKWYDCENDWSVSLCMHTHTCWPLNWTDIILLVWHLVSLHSAAL